MTTSDLTRSLLTSHSSPLKLGLLGGSFNPIHNGHLTIARLVCDQLRLDQVLFIPTGDPPHKRNGSLAPAKDRYEMVRLALAGTPSFHLSDIELRRSGKSYSIDTIRELQRQFGSSAELYFLIGLDAFLDLPNWKEPKALLHACRLVVVPRPGQSFQSLANMPLLPALDTQTLAQLDAGTLPRLDIAMSSRENIICLPIPPCSISASEIRQRIRQRTTQANMLPPPVESYILQHRLYQEDCDRTNI
ncbi:MAG: nicotinate-nucleotide adenylyltransferase [Nitrospira sp.]|nr:nicotinate-nucleotide adenylyltransferase [Nitrospira sp.]MBH0184842.1 nicotinate-nucleotide adenylyltransferase [Nitrospira sp.]